MPLIETVIVPYDFSKRCRMAVEHGVALARHFQARIVFLHVIPYSTYEYAAFEGGAYLGGAWPSEAEVRGNLERQIRPLVENAENLAWEIALEKGDPPGRIEEAAQRFPAPILVMPTHGFGAFRRFVLGSVTTKVLHDIKVPVYTGAHLEDSPVFAKGEAHHVACAVDLGEHSEAVLDWAARYAESWSAKLTLIHAVNWLETAPLDEDFFTPELVQGLEASAEQDARALIAQVGHPADLKIDVESAATYVPQAIRECGADVLVIGRSLDRSMVGRLREHAYKLIRESPVPVISV
ncbi:MAG: universal stress protein [Bryobacterales bacterium]